MTFPALDMWVLATTRQISGGDAAALEKEGTALGLDVLILDWDAGVVSLPWLAILCGGAPSAVAAHFGRNANVKADLSKIRSDPQYRDALSEVRGRLLKATVGYEAAKEAVSAWMQKQMRSIKTARLAFDSYANLEQPDNHRVERPKVNTALGQWWSADRARPAVLLGEEGVGKTWALLAWWQSRSSDPDFPLTMAIPATKVDTSDGPQLIAKAIHTTTGLRDVEYWIRRLRRWMTDSSRSTKLLIIIDGLNQHWSFERWSELVLSLNVGVWESSIAIAMTCRPDHWRSRLHGLADLDPAPYPVWVTGFDDTELDQLLKSYGTSRSDFSGDLIDFLRIPRLCHIAVERRSELQSSGDITRERLIYEDWRHRPHHATRVVSDEEFRSFITQLGQRFLDDKNKVGELTRAQLLERLSGDSGRLVSDFGGVVSEIVDGRWVEGTGTAHHFRIRPDRLPVVLGLALSDEVERAASEGEAAEIIATRMEPFQALDGAVAILRNASTFALLRSSASEHGRRALLLRWIHSQNFSPIDFEVFWRHIGCSPVTVLDVVESIWFKDRSGAQEDEIFVKAFANAWRWPDVAVEVEKRLTVWLSRYWLDPLEGAVSRLPNDELAASRRARTSERAALWKSSSALATIGITLCEVIPDGQSWGSYRAIAMMSWLPRAKLIRPLKAWAITRAVLGVQRQQHEVNWLLRWNDIDPANAEAAVLKTADELFSFGETIASNAAACLLEALATPAARVVYDQRVPAAAPRASYSFETVRVAPDGTLAWTENAARSVSVTAQSPMEAVWQLSAYANDPYVVLPSRDEARLQELAEEVSNEALWSEPTDRAIDGGKIVLSRWAPEARAKLERRRFEIAKHIGRPRSISWSAAPRLVRSLFPGRRTQASVSAREKALKRVEHLGEALLVLDGETLDSWKRFAAEERTSPNTDTPTHQYLQAIALAGGTFSEQVELIETGKLLIDPDGPFRRLLTPPTEQEFLSLEGHLSAALPAEDLQRRLAHLLSIAPACMPKNWQPLRRLLGHADQAVRNLVLQIALKVEDVGLADALDTSGWSYPQTSNKEEIVLGSLLLTSASSAETNPAIASRIHPESLGLLAERNADQSVYLDQFADFVDAEINLLIAAQQRDYPRALFSAHRGWDLLVVRQPERIVEWLSPLASGLKELGPFYILMERFPLLDVLVAYAKLDAKAAVAILELVLRSQRSSPMRFGNLYEIAASWPGEEGDVLRELALSDANDDSKLFSVAMHAQESGRLGWLLARIRKDLSGPTAGEMARGLTLAGFLDECPEANELWQTTLAVPPTTGWLTTIHAVSKRQYDLNRLTMVWYETFRDSPSDDQAFAAYELFASAIDDRIFLGSRHPDTAEVSSWSWKRRAHWSFQWPNVRSRLKSVLDSRAKLFLNSRPAGHAQIPSMRG